MSHHLRVEREPLADWFFSVEEVSNNVWRARGMGPNGLAVELRGTEHPDLVLERCRKRAVVIIENEAARLEKRAARRVVLRAFARAPSQTVRAWFRRGDR
jgi:hypothetical protein